MQFVCPYVHLAGNLAWAGATQAQHGRAPPRSSPLTPVGSMSMSAEISAIFSVDIPE